MRRPQYPSGVPRWEWAANKGGENQLWAGSIKAGLRLKLKGEEFDWESPLHGIQSSHTEVPKSWGGDKATGGVAAVPSAGVPHSAGTAASNASGGASADSAGGLDVVAWTGPLTLQAGGAPTVFKLDLLVTPVKTLDTPRHFRRDRYYQYGYNGHADCAEIAKQGVKVLNLHQGVDLNPYINYPFVREAMQRQANFSRWCKSLGVESTKLYYTTRELSNRCHEMPALRRIQSADPDGADRVFDGGAGGGGSWLQEHLQDDYHVRWSTALDTPANLTGSEAIDEAVADTGLSRWMNFYIEGLQWLAEEASLRSDTADAKRVYGSWCSSRASRASAEALKPADGAGGVTVTRASPAWSLITSTQSSIA